MSKRFRVTYVGDDSLQHVQDVTADDSESAKEVAKRQFDADPILSVEQVRPAFATAIETLLWLVGISILLVLLYRAMF